MKEKFKIADNPQFSYLQLFIDIKMSDAVCYNSRDENVLFFFLFQ